MEKLYTKNIELTKNIFELKQAFDVEKIISLNAKQINSKAGKSFFAFVQRLALKNFILNLCKIYEGKTRNKLNSIPSIINYIQSNNLTPKNPKIAEEFILRKDQKIFKKNHFGDTFQDIFKSFMDVNSEAFERFKTFRDVKIAHSEDSVRKEITNLPGFAAMETFLFFAVDFYEIIHKTYIGGIPVDHRWENRTSISLLNILRELNFTNIKKDFEV